MLIIHGWNYSFAPEERLKENIHLFTIKYFYKYVVIKWKNISCKVKFFSNLEDFQIIRKPK